MVNATPKRIDMVHEVNLAEPLLDAGADPTSILKEVYACARSPFAITPNDITITKSDSIGQAKLTVSVLPGNGAIEFTASGYRSRFENLSSDKEIAIVVHLIGEFNKNIERVPEFQECQYSAVHLGIWYGIEGGRAETDRLLNSLSTLDNSQEIGATDSWISSYRRAYHNQKESWLLGVSIEPSASDLSDLYFSVYARYDSDAKNRSIQHMVAHANAVRDHVLKSIKIEVRNA